MQASGIRTNPSASQVSADIIATLRDIPVALLSDNMQRNRGSVGLQPYHRPAPLVGTAVTVLTRGGDNLAILRAFEFCRPGDVMVVDAGADITNAVIGGILSFYGASIGLAGMVIDGAIRDVAEIRERDFPVYARGSMSPSRSAGWWFSPAIWWSAIRTAWSPSRPTWPPR